MKRWISILVMVLVVFSLIGGAAFAQSDPLIDIAMDMARDLHTLANDEKYFELMGYTYTRDYISAFAAVDCDEMRSVYRVTSAATLIAQVTTSVRPVFSSPSFANRGCRSSACQRRACSSR